MAMAVALVSILQVLLPFSHRITFAKARRSDVLLLLPAHLERE